MNKKRSTYRRRLVSLVAFFAFAVGAIDTYACSMFTMTLGDRVLMGNNEDYIKPGYVWFMPGGRNRLGRVNFGFDDKFAQGSMNEKGLCFDAAVVPEVPYARDDDKKTPENLIEKIMNECTTVDEAIDYFRRFNAPHLSRTQFMFADKTGASVVIAWMPETGLSIVRKTGDHQLITNTRLEISAYRCERFVIADRVLTADGEDPVAVARDALASIHQRGPQAYTSYSNIFDLVRGEIYVYNLADYDEVVTFNLAEELEKGKQSHALSELFTNGDRLAEMTSAEPRRYDTESELSGEILDRYAGTYEAPGGAGQFTLRRDANELILAGAGDEAHLYPESETLFRIREGGQITFDVNDTGAVNGLTLHRFGDHFAKRIGD